MESTTGRTSTFGAGLAEVRIFRQTSRINIHKTDQKNINLHQDNWTSHQPEDVIEVLLLFNQGRQCRTCSHLQHQIKVDIKTLAIFILTYFQSISGYLKLINNWKTEETLIRFLLARCGVFCFVFFLKVL